MKNTIFVNAIYWVFRQRRIWNQDSALKKPHALRRPAITYKKSTLLAANAVEPTEMNDTFE